MTDNNHNFEIIDYSDTDWTDYLEPFSKISRLFYNPSLNKTIQDKNVIIAQAYYKNSPHIPIWNDVYHSLELGEFEISNLSLENPLNKNEWNSIINSKGCLLETKDWLKRRVFMGGVTPELQSQVWLYLIDIYPMNSTFQSRQRIQSDLRNEFNLRLKMCLNGKLNAEWIIAIDKDVTRTDQNLSFYQQSNNGTKVLQKKNGELNEKTQDLKDILVLYSHVHGMKYIQGMSDLVSLLFMIHNDKALAYHHFIQWMDKRMKRDFINDDGIHDNLNKVKELLEKIDPGLYTHLKITNSDSLLFTYRWFLVCFRREFQELKECVRLWDALLSDYLNVDWRIYISASILIDHRDPIMKYLMTFEEVYEYMQQLSAHLSVSSVIMNALYLYKQVHNV